MIIGVPKETFPGEQRVALIPASIAALTKVKAEVIVEAGAGDDVGEGLGGAVGEVGVLARDAPQRRGTRAFVVDVGLDAGLRAAGAGPDERAVLLQHQRLPLVLGLRGLSTQDLAGV